MHLEVTSVNNNVSTSSRLQVSHIMSEKYNGLLIYKNSSRDEIANVNFYAVRSGSYLNSLK